ncbi:MAG: hypothetical protein KA945_03600 [Zoogloea sp.]|nr:hypothetical protein [Zoogloea sp.]
MKNLIGKSDKTAVAAVKGETTGAGGYGVWGTCDTGHGVHGDSKTSRGVVGTSDDHHGVFGKSKNNVGVVGESDEFDGVWGVAKAPNKAGVVGISKAPGGRGVAGDSVEFQGVFGRSTKNAGVVGESDLFDGVWGLSKNPKAAGVSGHNVPGGLAGYFEGDVIVTGDIRLVNADCAEDFDVTGIDKMEPGTVMVLGHEGGLACSEKAYDKRVVGVVSGAGHFKPGIVMDKQAVSGNRQPIALLGKVFCKVDARFGAIEIGDLLTTSETPGHAMRTDDPSRAFGAVIGKALRAFTSGQGMIPILIALQ